MDFLDELGLHQLWEKIKGLISSQTSNYAVDSAVVHIAGSETVTGPKTFSGGVTVASGAVISGGAEVSGRFAISSGGADFEIPSGDPNDATKFLRGDGAWAEITSAASADTITTTLPISLGGTGESTKNMAVSALFNDNVGSNAAYLLGATSTFASAGYVDANDAKALLGITQSDIVSMIGTEPVASASTATDAASLGGVAASNYVTLNTDQNITGIKTFVGQKKIKFQQSGANDKLGFTLYNSAGVEQGYLEYNPTNKINGAPLMTLGNYASAPAGVSYVGFRKYSNITGSAGAYNLLTPLIADARTPFSLTTTYSNFFLPLGVTDGTSMVMTDSSGVLNISALLPSGYTLPPATTTSIGGVAIGSGLDVTSAGDVSVDSAYVSSAALDAVSSGGYITTSEASTIIADQISSGGYVTSSDTVANASSLGGIAASGYVTTSGAQEITGAKTFSAGMIAATGDILQRNGDTAWIRINGGTAYTNGASLLLYGKDAAQNPSKFLLQAHDGTTGSTLTGSPDGTLTWGGKGFVYDSGDQEIDGQKTFKKTMLSTENVVCAKPSTSGEAAYFGGTGYQNGACCILYGKDSPAGAGLFRLRAANGTTYYDLLGYADGKLYWGGNAIQSTEWHRENDTSYIRVSGGTGYTNGASLWLHGQSQTSYDGQWRLEATKDNRNTSYQLQGRTNGEMITTFTMFRPIVNGALIFGASSIRVGQIYTTNNVNVGSDERIKQQIATIPNDVLDAWEDINWIQFKYNDACEEKGADKARLHNGLIAQRVDDAFKAHGLDATAYGLFCYDEWEGQPEKKDDDGNIIQEAIEAGDAYSLRYEEALCMEAAYQRRRADRAEARITTLESRLNELEEALSSLISHGE